jgi:hypothetical integral membrane protein (TIGR02206 family)
MTHPHYIVPLFSETWYYGIIFTFMFYFLLLRLGTYYLQKGVEPLFRHILAAIFIIREIYLYSYIISEDQFTLQDSLPLHLCRISYLFMIVFLLKPNFFIFEFLLMLGLAGALQSFITPELTHGYSDFLIIDYYFSHGGIIFTPIYALFILNMRPRTGSWLRVFIFSNLLLASVFVINLLLDSNYIYLMQAPIVDNPMVLGPYPTHLIGFEIFGTLHILLFYWWSRKLPLRNTILQT